MSRRRTALTYLLIGIAMDAIARLSSIRQTWVNGVLTGASVILVLIGLFLLWRARTAAQAGT